MNFFEIATFPKILQVCQRTRHWMKLLHKEGTARYQITFAVKALNTGSTVTIMGGDGPCDSD